MAAKDFIFGLDGDLTISGGDFLVSESDAQHIEHIIRADKGQYRQFPLIGFGIQSRQNAPVNVQEVKQEIRKQLISDGFTVRSVKIDGELNINVDVERLKNE